MEPKGNYVYFFILVKQTLILSSAAASIVSMYMWEDGIDKHLSSRFTQ